MSTVDHPQVTKMFNHFIHKDSNGENNWYLYILMEYAENGDLHQLIEKSKKHKEYIDEDKIWEICRQVTEGLCYLHS